MGKRSSWQVEEDLREPQSFYTSSLSSELEKADPYKQIGHSHAQSGIVDAATNSEQHCSSREVAQSWLHSVWNQLVPEPGPSGPRTSTTSGGIHTTPELNATSHTSGTPKKKFWQAPHPTVKNSALKTNPAQHLIYGDQGLPVYSVN